MGPVATKVMAAQKILDGSKQATSAVSKTLKKGTRPKFVPTDSHRVIVSALGQAGATVQHIASHIINPATGRGVSTRTLYRHFSAELEDNGLAMRVMAIGTVARVMRHGQDRDALRAAMFWLNTRCGFAKQSTRAVTNDPPREVVNMTPERLAQIAENLRLEAEYLAQERVVTTDE
jgi:AcrR family transcriptional regulator